MPNENENKQEKGANANRQGWNIAELAEQSTNKSSDEMKREFLRGDETIGDADERDVVGSVDSSETPQGREEAKIGEKRGEVENG